MSQTSQEILQGLGNETIEVARLTSEQASAVTQNPWFFVPFIGMAFLAIIIYIIWGALSKTTNSYGETIKDSDGSPLHPIQKGNFWITFIIFFMTLITIILFMLYPFWLDFFT